MKKILLLSFLSLTCLCRGQAVSNGLQACYPLDGNITNYAPTGSALNGIGNNVSLATGHTGITNTAYSLSGDTGSYIKLPNDIRLKPNALTFSGWFYPDSLPLEQYLVYTKNYCSYNFEAYSLITYYQAGQQVFRVSKSGSNCNYAPQANSFTSPVTGQWYHIAFSLNDSNVLLYVNGVLEVSLSLTVQYSYNTTKSVFLGGTHELNFNKPYKGRIDNVRFYDRMLSAQEISTLYADNYTCNGDSSPVAKFQKPDREICIGQSVVFADQSSNNPTSWSWQLPGGSPATSTASNPASTYAAPGVYSVTLVASNSAGSSTTMQTITVSVCTSVKEIYSNTSQVLVYPNPSTGTFLIEHLPNSVISVTDNLGRQVSLNQTRLSDTRSEVVLRGVSEGIYLLRVADLEKDQVHWSKITIIR